jgi:hypothetical protein
MWVLVIPSLLHTMQVYLSLGRSHSRNSFNESKSFVESQCDQIGKNFANWAKIFSIRQFLFKEKIAQWFGQNFSWIKLVGGLLGPFFVVIGQFFHKNIWSHWLLTKDWPWLKEFWLWDPASVTKQIMLSMGDLIGRISTQWAIVNFGQFF